MTDLEKDPDSPAVYSQKRAASYDKGWTKIVATRDAMDLLIRILLSDLPAEARVLCVGVGTGSELINLAEAFPRWQFTAVEPAAPMLEICRRRVEEAGFTPRCTFHNGYLDSLPASGEFDAATCLLVSHAIMQTEDRSRFFGQIASRLRPQGYLINADLASDMASTAYQSLLAVWMRMLKFADVPDEEAEKYRTAYGREAAILPPDEVAEVIASGGFDAPVQFYQSLLIHAWYCRRT